MISMAAMVTASGMSQDASPVATVNGTATAVLREFLQQVIGQGDARAVEDYFDADEFDVEALYWEFTDMQSDARRQEEAFKLDIRLLYGDDDAALAYGTFGAGSWTNKDFFFAINAKAGKITRCRWMTEMA
jgi:hypothetical protein